MVSRFQQAMRLMRRRDPQLREDGFHQLPAYAADHLDELIAEFDREQDDRGLRGWLLELIGEARSPAALPLLAAQLNSTDESLRAWAVVGLEKLDTREARTLLWHARNFHRLGTTHQEAVDNSGEAAAPVDDQEPASEPAEGHPATRRR